MKSLLDEQRESNLVLYYYFLKKKQPRSSSEERELEILKNKCEHRRNIIKYLKGLEYIDDNDQITPSGKDKVKEITLEARNENKNGITYASYLSVFIVLLLFAVITANFMKDSPFKIIAGFIASVGVFLSLIGAHLYWHGSSHEHTYYEYLKLNRIGDGLLALVCILSWFEVMIIFIAMLKHKDGTLVTEIILPVAIVVIPIVILLLINWKMGKVGERSLIGDILIDLKELLP